MSFYRGKVGNSILSSVTALASSFQKMTSEKEPFIVGIRKSEKLISSLLPADVFKAAIQP